MTRSPLTIKAINSLIGKTMRRIQLEANDLVRFYLSLVMCRLNKARRGFKLGWSMSEVTYDLEQGLNWLRRARDFKASIAD